MRQSLFIAVTNIFIIFTVARHLSTPLARLTLQQQFIFLTILHKPSGLIVFVFAACCATKS